MMKTVAIANPSIQGLREGNLFSVATVSNQSFNVGLVEMDPISLLPKTDINKYVLVKKLAFSCNYRDQSVILHLLDSCKKIAKDEGPSFFPLGSEFVGVVIQVGKDVSTLSVGDRVIPDGSYPTKISSMPGLPTNLASQRVEMFNEHDLCRIPESMPNEVAASFTIGAQTVYSMIRRLSIKPAMNILITAGTSNTALFALEALKNTSANVYVITSKYKNFDRFKDFSIKEFIPSPLQHQWPIRNVAARIGNFDIVIDPFSDLYLHHLIGCMNFFGQYISCGVYQQHANHKLTSPSAQQSKDSIITTCIVRNVSIIGNCLGNREDLERAIQDFQTGNFNVKIDSVYSGNAIKEFFDRTFNDGDRFGKVVYNYSDE